MDILPFLTQAAGLGLSAWASPGSLQAYLISESLRGWRRGAVVALAPLISDTPIILLCLLLLARLPAGVLRAIEIGGGLYLLWLAWHTWKASQAAQVLAPAEGQAFNSLWRAALINLLNPNPYLFWLGQGNSLITLWKSGWWWAILYLLVFYTIFLGLMVGLAVITAQGRHLGEKFVRRLLLFNTALFVLLALRFLLGW